LSTRFTRAAYLDATSLPTPDAGQPVRSYHESGRTTGHEHNTAGTAKNDAGQIVAVRRIHTDLRATATFSGITGDPVSPAALVLTAACRATTIQALQSMVSAMPTRSI
jgi:hypothetical protein